MILFECQDSHHQKITTGHIMVSSPSVKYYNQALYFEMLISPQKNIQLIK